MSLKLCWQRKDKKEEEVAEGKRKPVYCWCRQKLAEIWEEMESREDLNSILPFLPLVLRSSNLFWPSQVVETLNSMAAGPDQSGLTTGDALFHSISAIRNSLSLTNQPLASSAHHGYSLFFDKVFQTLGLWYRLMGTVAMRIAWKWSTKFSYHSFTWSKYSFDLRQFCCTAHTCQENVRCWTFLVNYVESVD